MHLDELSNDLDRCLFDGVSMFGLGNVLARLIRDCERRMRNSLVAPNYPGEQHHWSRAAIMLDEARKNWDTEGANNAAHFGSQTTGGA